MYQAVKFNLDPSKIAGPLETAFQDIVGQSFLLGAGYLVFHSFEDQTKIWFSLKWANIVVNVN